MTDSIVELEIEALAYGGSGVGTVTNGPTALKGKRGFVPFSAPGDRVRARVVNDKQTFVEAALLQVLHPSDYRTSPRCQYFGACGGCDYQHITLQAQREAKRALVESTLLRQFKVIPQQGVTLIGAELPGWEYRRRISLHVDAAGNMGFYRPRSGEVVAIAQCAISSPEINRAIGLLVEPIGKLAPLVAGVIIEETQQGPSILIKPRVPTAENDRQLDSLRGIFPSLHIESIEKRESEDAETLGHFSQVNAAANKLLVSTICERLSVSPILELYAGSGNFTLPLAHRGAQLTAVEVDKTLVRQAQLQAQEEGLQNRITFLAVSTEAFLRSYTPRGTILLDPPRSGAKVFAQRASPNQVERIVYVSCSVPTLGRDLQILSKNGFQVHHTDVLDMFPQTHHVETITELVPA